MKATFPDAEQVLSLYRESLWPWRKLPDPGQQKVVAAIELLILQGRNIPLDGRAILVENYAHARACREWPRGHQPAAQHSRPGDDIIRLVSPDEIAAFAAYRRAAQRIIEDFQLGSFDEPSVTLPILEVIRRTSELGNADSLDVQAHIDAESMRTAWRETYGKSQNEPSAPAPAIATDQPPSARKDETAPVSSPSISPKQPGTLPAEPSARWRTFTSITLNCPEVIQGIYAIVEIATGRLYVGSSNNIVRRLSDHAAALRAQRHHAQKLQEAWGVAEGFRFLLVERITGSTKALREREQYWISELSAFPHGFNSKSTADGPEPSLHTQIDAAIKESWAPLYAHFASRKQQYQPNAADLSSYKEELKAAYLKKIKHAVIAFILALVAAAEPALPVLWVGVVGYAVFIFLDWPGSPQKRADARAETDYRNAEAEARRKTDDLLIGQLAAELGLSEKRIRAAYGDAPRIVQRRNQLRENIAGEMHGLSTGSDGR